jgi:peptidoglycan pentaglycine glycine transferase (the first glycine)
MDAEYICRISADEDNPAWDDFVSRIPGAHHEQTIPWANVRMFHGWHSKRIILEKDGRIMAGTQLLIKSIKYFGKIGYISYGPCLAEKSVEIAEKLVQEIIRMAGLEKITYMTINLPYYGDYMKPLLLKKKFLPIIDGIPPPRLMTTTLLINLEKSLDELLAEMKIKTRYNINHSIRKGIEIREGTREDIDLFFNLMLATCERRNTLPSHPDKGFFELLWDNFYSKGWLRIHIAEYNKEPVCAGLSFSFGDTFRFWKFGWSGAYGKYSPNNGLYWKLIELAKQDGFRRFDLVYLETKVVNAIQQGLPVTPELEATHFYGPTHFKMGFGGDVMHLPGAYCYFPNPFIRKSYNIVGNLLLKQKWILKTFLFTYRKMKRKESE